MKNMKNMRNKLLLEVSTNCPSSAGWMLAPPNKKTDGEEYTQGGKTWIVKKCDDNKFYKKEKSASPPPSTSLPAWVAEKGKCIEKYVDGLKPYASVNAKPEQIVGRRAAWGDVELYFEPKNRFVYYDVTGNTDYVGTWKCDNDVLILYTESDKEEWRSDTREWKKRVVVTTPVDCKPFTNKKEADEFRLWVNKNYPEIAADIPGLPVTMTDKKLSRHGKCTSTHIRTAAKHKINDIELIDLFRKKEVVTQEKNPHEERNKWMEKNKSRFEGGEIKIFISNGFELKVYQKIKDGYGFRYFPPNGKGEYLYVKYSDVSFGTPLGKGQYKLEEEPTNESIKRWLDIMNKTGRVSITEQIDVPGTYTSYEAPIKKQEDDPIKKQEADKHAKLANLSMEHFVSMPWSNPTQMAQKATEVQDLIENGYRGLEFAFFLQGLDIKGYADLKKNIETVAIDNYTFTDPTKSDMESGDFESKTVSGFKNPLYYKRGENMSKPTELYSFNEEGCIKALADFYTSCGGKTKTKRTRDSESNMDIILRTDYNEYIKSEEFIRKKRFIKSCDTKGYYVGIGKGDLKDITIELMSRSTEKDHPGKDKEGRSACQIIFTTKR